MANKQTVSQSVGKQCLCMCELCALNVCCLLCLIAIAIASLIVNISESEFESLGETLHILKLTNLIFITAQLINSVVPATATVLPDLLLYLIR